MDELLDEALEETFPASDPPAMLEPVPDSPQAGEDDSRAVGCSIDARSRPACAIPDLEPECYARWRASKIGASTERLERRLILELIGDIGGRRVLDVGCGDGELALALVKRGAIVMGIDASAAMIDAPDAGPSSTPRKSPSRWRRPSSFRSRPDGSTW